MKIRPFKQHYRKIGLVWILIFLVLATLASTIALIASVAYIHSKSTLQAIEKDHYRVAVTEASNEVRQILRPDSGIVREFQILLQKGLLAEDDFSRISAIFIERLRFPACLTGLNFVSKSGQFVGVDRLQDGQFKVRTVHSGLPHGYENLIFPDGRSLPRFSRDLLFDMRKRPWYAAGIYAGGKVIWLPPYQFLNGRYGISVACAVFAQRTGQFMGVLCADFSLEAIQSALNGLLSKQNRLLFLTMRDKFVAESTTLDPSLSGELHQHCLRDNLDSLRLSSNEVSFHSFRWKRVSYVGVLKRLLLDERVECYVGLVAPESEFLGIAKKNIIFATGIGLGSFVVAACVAVILSMKLVRPLSEISRDLERVARFEIGISPAPVSPLYEVRALSNSTERMKRSIQSFVRYVPDYVVRKLLRENKEAHLEATSREISVFASDLEGFTSMAERLSANQLVDALDEYFELVIPTIEGQFGGTVDKLVGDGIIAFFNALDERSNHAEGACCSAISIIQLLEKISRRRIKLNLPSLRARIGLATGTALVGNFGTEERLAFTAIGMPVAIATQLEQMNKQFGTRCLADGKTRQEAGRGFEWRAMGEIQLFSESIHVFELIGREGEVSDSFLQARDLFEEARKKAAKGNKQRALDLLEQALKLRPGDLAARNLRDSLVTNVTHF